MLKRHFPGAAWPARAAAGDAVAHVFAVGLPRRGRGHTGPREPGRHKIAAAHHGRIVDFPGRDAGLPAHDEGYAHAALVEPALAAAERPGRAHAAVAGIRPENFPGAGVARENVRGVFRDAELRQFVPPAADLRVGFRYARVVNRARARLRDGRVTEAIEEPALPGRRVEPGVEQRPELQIKRFCPAALDENSID